MSARNELVDETIETVMRAIGGCFDELWERDDAVEILDAFLGQRIALVIDRGGLTILERTTAPD